MYEGETDVGLWVKWGHDRLWFIDAQGVSNGIFKSLKKTYCSNSNSHILYRESIKNRESIDRLKGLGIPIYH